MDPVTTAAFVSGGAKLLGGILGRSKGKDNPLRWRNQKRVIRGNVKNAQAMFDAQVSSYDKAGLHRVLLAANPGAFHSSQPVTIGRKEPDTAMANAIAGVGQSVANVYASQKTPEQKEFDNANLRVLTSTADKNESESAYWASEAARNHQSNVMTKALPSLEPINETNLTQVTPDVAISKQKGAPYHTANIHPGFTRIQTPVGLMSIPGGADGLQEILSEGSAKAALAIYNINRHIHGEQQAITLAKFFTGVDPTETVYDQVTSWIKSKYHDLQDADQSRRKAYINRGRTTR